jgi:IPT/TIG domain-containing protein
MLLYLFCDYVRDDEVKEQFAQNPEKVLKKYKVEGPAREAVLSGNRSQVLKQLLSEVRELFNGGGGPRKTAAWSPVIPTVTSFKPLSGPVGQPIDFTINGTNFQPGAQVTFQRPGTTAVRAQNVIVSSSKRITCTATFKNAGEYQLKVVNPGGGSGVAPSMFNAT